MVRLTARDHGIDSRIPVGATIPASGVLLITCLLPRGAAILFGVVVGWEDVGS